MAENINGYQSNNFSNDRKINSNLFFNDPDFLEKVEYQLKEIWSQYIHCLDKYGLNETARELKKKYLGLYQKYKNYRDWRNAIDGSAHRVNHTLCAELDSSKDN